MSEPFKLLDLPDAIREVNSPKASNNSSFPNRILLVYFFAVVFHLFIFCVVLAWLLKGHFAKFHLALYHSNVGSMC